MPNRLPRSGSSAARKASSRIWTELGSLFPPVCSLPLNRRGGRQMNQASYLASLRADAALLREAAQRDLTAPAPSCPGWTTGHLLVHIGQAYNWIGEIVATRAQGPVHIRPEDHACDRADPGIFDWFDRSLATFVATLAASDPDEPVWTWSRDHRIGFWLRLMAHETA